MKKAIFLKIALALLIVVPATESVAGPKRKTQEERDQARRESLAQNTGRVKAMIGTYRGRAQSELQEPYRGSFVTVADDLTAVINQLGLGQGSDERDNNVGGDALGGLTNFVEYQYQTLLRIQTAMGTLNLNVRPTDSNSLKAPDPEIPMKSIGMAKMANGSAIPGEGFSIKTRNYLLESFERMVRVYIGGSAQLARDTGVPWQGAAVPGMYQGWTPDILASKANRTVPGVFHFDWASCGIANTLNGTMRYFKSADGTYQNESPGRNHVCSTGNQGDVQATVRGNLVNVLMTLMKKMQEDLRTTGKVVQSSAYSGVLDRCGHIRIEIPRMRAEIKSEYNRIHAGMSSAQAEVKNLLQCGETSGSGNVELAAGKFAGADQRACLLAVLQNRVELSLMTEYMYCNWKSVADEVIERFTLSFSMTQAEPVEKPIWARWVDFVLDHTLTSAQANPPTAGTGGAQTGQQSGASGGGKTVENAYGGHGTVTGGFGRAVGSFVGGLFGGVYGGFGITINGQTQSDINRTRRMAKLNLLCAFGCNTEKVAGGNAACMYAGVPYPIPIVGASITPAEKTALMEGKSAGGTPMPEASYSSGVRPSSSPSVAPAEDDVQFNALDSPCKKFCYGAYLTKEAYNALDPSSKQANDKLYADKLKECDERSVISNIFSLSTDFTSQCKNKCDVAYTLGDLATTPATDIPETGGGGAFESPDVGTQATSISDGPPEAAEAKIAAESGGELPSTEEKSAATAGSVPGRALPQGEKEKLLSSGDKPVAGGNFGGASAMGGGSGGQLGALSAGSTDPSPTKSGGSSAAGLNTSGGTYSSAGGARTAGGAGGRFGSGSGAGGSGAGSMSFGGAAGEGGGGMGDDVMLSKDPENYFSFTPPEEDLFKVIERRYRKAQPRLLDEK